jgi:hypothetical protein
VDWVRQLCGMGRRPGFSLHNGPALQSRRLDSENSHTAEKGLTAKIFVNQCD